MTENAGTTARIALSGDWAITGVSTRLSELTAHLHALVPRTPNSGDASMGPEICLAAVETIDASGCQLLSVFFDHLRRHGLSPRPVNLPGHVQACADLLGFAPVMERTGF
ncbi:MULTISPECIES: STAS domain-containing protein [Geobacter]|uniref:STAS domain-containing protein n=1 Tax=Geobacter TaxID=28231 RepID=UPI00257237C2|nr:hypothetical protein [Geobacter sulfurreducens]BEH08812.1 hypothetical protein GSUET_04240 [Geobacter sulfurreducens subsp. ethanolicus]BET60312.1 hypothetical protein GEO60473_33520 [Geobacter sp. 60473]HML77720.1 hypothetical protein [Geobacter sulfurreducens]